jgi:hypothetical protein
VDESGHYYCGIKSCGVLNEEEVCKSINNFYSHLLRVLVSDIPQNDALRRAILDCLCIEYGPDDASQHLLFQIFPILHNLKESRSFKDSRLNQLAGVIFKLLAMQQVGNVRKDSFTSSVSLQTNVIELLFGDFERTLTVRNTYI